MNILPQPGNDWKSWAQALVSALQRQQPSTSYVVDTKGRPIVTPQGIYAYSGSGASVVAPDLISINTEDLVNAAITTAKLADTSVSSAKLVDLAVQAAKLADSSVTTSKIANAAVGTAAIADAAVGTAQIANAAITSALIGDLEVIQAKIADLAVNDAKIANVAAGKLTAGIIGAGQIYVGNDSVEIDGVNKRIIIQDPSTSPPTPYAYLGVLPDGSVGLQILDSTGTTVLQSASTTKAFDSSVVDALSTTNAPRQAGADVTSQNTAASFSGQGPFATLSQITGANSGTYIANGAIGNALIGNAAINNAKIADASINNAKIADASISTAKIQNGAITNALIGNAAIGSANIGTAAINNTLFLGQGVVTIPVTGFQNGNVYGNNTVQFLCQATITVPVATTVLVEGFINCGFTSGNRQWYLAISNDGGASSAVQRSSAGVTPGQSLSWTEYLSAGTTKTYGLYFQAPDSTAYCYASNISVVAAMR